MTATPVVRVNQASPVPPFEQVRQQIVDLITSGVLKPGTKLPPVRQLAHDLGLANGTVARAYQEMEAAGLVTTQRGGGTRVAEPPTPTGDTRAAALATQARGFVAAARRLGADDEEIATALRTALEDRP